MLDHAHDFDDVHQLEDARFVAEHRQLKEVHHPHEGTDYDGYQDEHFHAWHQEEPLHLRNPFEHYASKQNKMPQAPEPKSSKKPAAPESEEDPAICFVKAYARKPLGSPSTKTQKKSSQQPNALGRHDQFYEDEYEDEYSDEGNFSDTEENYYDEEEYANSSEEEETSEPEETSSDEDFFDE